MTRPRYPAPYAILHLILRLISVCLCIFTICSAGYASFRAAYGTGMVGAFVAAIFTMLVDLSEIAGLVDPARDVRRFSESAIIYLELLIIAVCGIVPIMVLMAFMGLQRRDCENWRPKQECDAEQTARDEVQIYVLLSWVLPLCLA
ncbi:uncharacterized protein P884DRAFT_303427 [Thermothelomyces heterothallicus CBS 202.75]|uniref:uncharacterized protein n=1 Tax=Thermothelomyces heterothallicus CBS 202.75 TaxID=1149848 RepID=UPI0037438190